jgi:hypothetical protein
VSRKLKAVGEIRHRERKPQDPVLLTQCDYCNNGFWYRPSMGLEVFNGYTNRLRVACGWCDKHNYVEPFNNV